MENKKIIITKPGTLSAKDKEKLTKDGHLVISHPDPHLGIVIKEFGESQYTFTNCYKCGERIYLLDERMSALKHKKATFYCSHGHSQSYL